MCIGQQSPSALWRSRGSLQTGGQRERKPIKTKTNRTLDAFPFKEGEDEEEEECAGRLTDGGYPSRRVTGRECVSAVVQRIDAPVGVVWSVVRRFDEPQMYKPFVRSCSVPEGRSDLKVGCLREVRLVTGLPATYSTERLEILDDERHILSVRIVGGDHRLVDYRSITSLHEAAPPSDETNGQRSGCTVVVESYVVDVAEGNTEEETRLFADTIVKCNLRSLARISCNLAVKSPL